MLDIMYFVTSQRINNALDEVIVFIYFICVVFTFVKLYMTINSSTENQVQKKKSILLMLL